MRYVSILTSCQFTNEPNRKISRGVFQNSGVCGQAFPLPLPLHPFFFCFRSNFPAITRLETLATQAKTKPVSKQAHAKTLSSLQNLIYLFIYLCKDSRQGSFLSLGKLLTSFEAPKRRTPEIGIHNCVFTVCGLCKE